MSEARPISWRSPDGSLQNIEAVILPEFARNQPPDKCSVCLEELIPPLHEFSCQRHKVHLACANVNPTLNADGSTRWTAHDVLPKWRFGCPGCLFVSCKHSSRQPKPNGPLPAAHGGRSERGIASGTSAAAARLGAVLLSTRRGHDWRRRRPCHI